ncbi:MAG: hypothetical protein ACREH8_05390, partial [Opitutaceae bacterium]
MKVPTAPSAEPNAMMKTRLLPVLFLVSRGLRQFRRKFTDSAASGIYLALRQPHPGFRSPRALQP